MDPRAEILCVINTTKKRNRKKKKFGETFSFIEFFDYYLHVQLSLKLNSVSKLSSAQKPNKQTIFE